MTGERFELVFLSSYMFTPSLAFILYGLAAALAAWVADVVAEMLGYGCKCYLPLNQNSYLTICDILIQDLGG